MDIESLYITCKDKGKEFSFTDIVDVNSKDPKGYTLLHFASKFNDVQFAKELMKRGIIYNSKTTEGKTPNEIASDTQMKKLFITIRMFFKAVKKGKYEKILDYITEEKSLVNVKEEGGGGALHWVVNLGRQDLIKLLLDNDADVFQVTDKGNTALHVAVSTGNAEIAEFLLQNIPVDGLFEFVNILTFQTKSTCLHIAAEYGHFDIVKLLLQRGAIYNIENNVGATPYDLSKDEGVKHLLKLINDIFVYTINGDDNLFSKLNNLECAIFEIIRQARDVKSNTIQELAVRNNQKDFVNKLSVLLKNHEQNCLEMDGWKYGELIELKYLANILLSCYKTLILKLRSYSYPSLSDVNYTPWLSLQQGSYFMRNAYTLVENYKTVRPGLIEDENIKIISDTLDNLQFDISHISYCYTNESCDGEFECVISKAHASKYYYKLLHSTLKKDVGTFIDIVTRNIDTAAQNFLVFLEEKLLLFTSYQLLAAIEENSVSKVDECLKSGADVNFDNCKPLLYAVQNRTLNILKILLDNGADIQHIFHQGNSILHIAMSDNSSIKSSKMDESSEIIKCLLKYGAIYNHRNERGKTPADESKCGTGIELLQIVEACFINAENDDPRLFRILKTIENDEFDAVTRSCNTSGHTLLNVAITAGRNVETKLLEIIKNTERMDKVYSPAELFERKLNKIKKLAAHQVRISEIYFPILRILSEPGGSEINSCPWKTLMEGSYYLSNAYNLVHEYKESLPLLPEDANIETIRKMLERFQFDPKHITSSLDEEMQYANFISSALGTEYYYKLLHNGYKKDVILFIELAEQFIHKPAELFLEFGIMSIYQQKNCVIL